MQATQVLQLSASKDSSGCFTSQLHVPQTEMLRCDATLGCSISSNNDGVMLIDNNDFPKAIRALSEAFHICRKHCAIRTSCHKTKLPTPKFDIDALLSSAENVGDSNRHNNSGFTYRRAIPMPQLLEGCPQSKFLIATIVTFNLALAYHLHAVDNCTYKSTAMLRRAVQLYETSRNLHRSKCKSSKALFQMIIMNNMGQIFRTLQDSRRSQFYFSRLLSSILYMTTHKKADPALYEGFFYNLFPQKQAGAAAA